MSDTTPTEQAHEQQDQRLSISTTVSPRFRFGAGLMTVTVLYYALTPMFSFERGALSSPTAKVATGLFLLVWIAMLWKLFSTRETGDEQEKRFWTDRKHELLGVSLPIPYFMHAAHLGHGIVLWLSIVFGTTILVGLLSPKTLQKLAPNWTLLQEYRFKFLWLVVHVALSTFLLILIALHVYTAIWYH